MDLEPMDDDGTDSWRRTRMAEPAGKTDRDMHSQGVEGAGLTAVTSVTSVLDVTT